MIDDRQLFVFSQIDDLVDYSISWMTADQAMQMMGFLRTQAQRIDNRLGNPNHQWNRVND